MKISVVTITLNRREFLKKAIESVLDQYYPDFEHIVIDGGSEDGTIDLLRQYPHLQWISEQDSGQADAMNKGLRRVTGEVFAWLNSDDTYPKETFHRVQKCFEESQGDLIYGRCNLVNKGGQIIGRTRMHPFNLRRLQMGFNNINTPAAFVRTSALRSAGEFDTGLKATYDVDMWIRIAQQFNVLAVDEIFSNLCLHDESGLVGTRAHVGELPLLRQKYWLHPTLAEKLLVYPYYQLREGLFNAIKFKALLKKI